MVHLDNRHKVKMGRATIKYFQGIYYMMEQRVERSPEEMELARRAQAEDIDTVHRNQEASLQQLNY